MSDADQRVAISPDGSRFVVVGRTDGIDRLYERSLDGFDTREIPGTDDAAAPFVSPDGRWVGFFADGHLKIVSTSGGAPIEVCDVPAKVAGGTWVADHTIVFGSEDGLFAVATSGGGAPARITHVDNAHGEMGHMWPHALPDGDSVMFTIWRTGLDRASLAVASMRTRTRRNVYEGGSDGRYLRSGQLLFARSGGAAVVPFDLGSLRVTGSPASVPVDAAVAPFDGVLQAAVADDGSLVYAPGSAGTPALHIVWVGSDGLVRPLALPVRPYRNVKLSPDGRRLAVTINEAADYDVWIGDVERGTLTRLTFGGRNIEPVWSPDGQWITYASTASGPMRLMRRRADGSGAAEQVAAGDGAHVPWNYSPAGDALMFGKMDPANGFDLWVLPSSGQPWPFLRTPFQEISPSFSPDGRIVAYVSNESGRYEVYVRPYPGPGGKWQVSTSGGERPFWSADGRRIYYNKGETLMAADITAQPDVRIGRPFKVLERQQLEWFGVAPGGRLLALQSDTPRSGLAQVNVVLNWLESVKDSVR